MGKKDDWVIEETDNHKNACNCSAGCRCGGSCSSGCNC